MNREHGFARVTVCSPEVVVGDPEANLHNTIEMLTKHSDSDVVVFPELGITGYTCGDLFKQQTLLNAAEKALEDLAIWSERRKQLIFVGAPLRHDTELFNCAVAVNDGQIIGVTGKQNVAEGTEFYEGHHFAAADGDESPTHQIGKFTFPFGIDLLYTTEEPFGEQLDGRAPGRRPSTYVPGRLDAARPNQLRRPATGPPWASISPPAPSKWRSSSTGPISSGFTAASTTWPTLYAGSGPSENTERSRVLRRLHHRRELANIGAVLATSATACLNFGPRSVTADIDYQMLAQEKRSDRSFGQMRKKVNCPLTNYLYWKSQ
jgi:hypothetical protein